MANEINIHKILRFKTTKQGRQLVTRNVSDIINLNAKTGIEFRRLQTKWGIKSKIHFDSLPC